MRAEYNQVVKNLINCIIIPNYFFFEGIKVFRIGVLIKEKSLFIIILFDFGCENGLDLAMFFNEFLVERIEILLTGYLWECLFFYNDNRVTANNLVEFSHPISF